MSDIAVAAVVVVLEAALVVEVVAVGALEVAATVEEVIIVQLTFIHALDACFYAIILDGRRNEDAFFLCRYF